MDEMSEGQVDNSRDPANDLCQGRIPKYLNCCARLHHALYLVKSNHVENNVLVAYLSATLAIMEDEANNPKFLDDDDNDETDTEVIPPEIKDWLASTFTNAVKYIRKSERPRFRAVAKAVLAMVMVEKIFKKSNENAALKIPQTVTKMMDIGINDWDFETFKLNELSSGQGLKYLTMYLFLHHNILRKYKISVDILEAFLDVIEEGYQRNNNPFYNSLHAADVLQIVHYFIHNSKLNVWMTDLQIFTILFVAIIHDYNNPGVSNSFLVKTNNILALTYNDIHVRENHQVSSVFQILQSPEYNFLRGMLKGDYSEFRRMAVECVLSMDITQHFHQIKQMKNELAASQELDKLKVMCYLLHVADFSIAAKRSKIHLVWMNMFVEQMYKQGDLEHELNIPYSPLCNRKKAINMDAMHGFLVHIVEPMFQLLMELLDEIVLQNTFVGPESPTDVPTMAKKASTIAVRSLYPWENLLVLNKSMWQRRILSKK